MLGGLLSTTSSGGPRSPNETGDTQARGSDAAIVAEGAALTAHRHGAQIAGARHVYRFTTAAATTSLPSVCSGQDGHQRQCGG